MSAHKNIDRICTVIIAITLIISILFCNGEALGVQITAHAAGYENRLFDQSKVHTINIIINDWDKFIENCESEEYSACNVIIDGETIRNVGIRAKGNTSLSSVKSMNSSRYSLKIEFDHYDNATTYHGLDKLCLNNIIQDNTYMKDYISYTLMNEFGVDAPLCSYADIKVNGEEWGLYIAVESIEDSFLNRNYGTQYGDLYKPESMNFGGGRGNGKDFKMDNMPDFANGEMPQFDMPEGFNFEDMGGEMPDFKGGMGGMGGMGSDDVKLNYTDDSIDSYSNIFNNAKTNVSTADKKRLINALKNLQEQSDIESTVNVEEVLRYFVVHNFLCNGDSYTGMMIHNYYLYEKNGQLSMIPWDYNLAFGTFQGSDASSSVNTPIDTPVSGGMSDRPMIAWIFDNEEYTEQYHELFNEFVSELDLASFISETAAMIDEYVQNDATKFCTYEEFQTGVKAISEFCELRTESIKGQLNGTIPSTTDGQNADSSALIDCSSLNISDMGTMGGMGGGMGGPGGAPNFSRDSKNENNNENFTASNMSNLQSGDVKALAFNGEKPEGFDPSSMPNGFDPSSMPEGFDPSSMPDGFDPSSMPNGFDPSSMSNGFDSSSVPEGFTPSSAPEENKTTDTSDNPEAQNSNSNEKSDRSQMNRPDMSNPGDFSGMGADSQTSNTTSLILLGVSAAILLFGIIFAFKFRR